MVAALNGENSDCLEISRIIENCPAYLILLNSSVVRHINREVNNGAHRCRRNSADFRSFATVLRQRGHVSTPVDSSSFPDHFPSPVSPPNSSFPARSPKTSNLGDLAGKLEFGGLAGDGKWSGKLLESAGVEARPRATPYGGERTKIRTVKRCRRP
ncbi:hypothetical protein ACLB2K_045603 [Fragaria x ananassa]